MLRIKLIICLFFYCFAVSNAQPDYREFSGKLLSVNMELVFDNVNNALAGLNKGEYNESSLNKAQTAQEITIDILNEILSDEGLKEDERLFVIELEQIASKTNDLIDDLLNKDNNATNTKKAERKLKALINDYNKLSGKKDKKKGDR